MKKPPKNLLQVAQWLDDRRKDWINSWDGEPPLAPSASPRIYIDTGTMKFEISGMSVQHGGPLDEAIILKMGNPVN